jgi:hypothetical protein
VSAEKDSSGRIVTTTWSEPVTAGLADGVRAYREDGSPVAGAASVGVSSDPKVMPIVLPPNAALDPSSVVLLAVDPGLVTAAGVPNAYATAAIGTGGQRPGYTDAPDLVSAHHDGPDRVSFAFDEPLGTVAVGRLQVLAGDGAMLSGAAAPILSGDRLSVSVQFPGTTVAAVGAVAPEGAVADDAGNAGVLGAVGIPVLATPAPTATATATPVPDAAADKLPERRVLVTALHGLKRRGRQITGQVEAASPCASHRKVTLSGGGRRLGKTRTTSTGAFRGKASRSVATLIKVRVERRVIRNAQSTVICQAITRKV